MTGYYIKRRGKASQKLRPRGGYIQKCRFLQYIRKDSLLFSIEQSKVQFAFSRSKFKLETCHQNIVVFDGVDRGSLTSATSLFVLQSDAENVIPSCSGIPRDTFVR